MSPPASTAPVRAAEQPPHAATLDRAATVEAEGAHQPFVPAGKDIPELTVVSVLMGSVLGVIFGASSMYLVLKVGLTVSASIPVAVLSITIFRGLSKALRLRNATILENNIVQTTGSAGESIAFGVGVTMPALLILGYNLEIGRVMLVAVLGGLLGILMMIPLRRALIVKEAKKLVYPEGTACAEVLIVGEKGGTTAKMVFAGFGVGGLFKLLYGGMKLFKDTPSRVLGSWYPGAAVSMEVAPELMGVGYIIGTRTSMIMGAGGILSSLVLIPAIKLFGAGLKTPVYPATKLISAMDIGDVWHDYVLFIGAGAVAAGGIISLVRSLPLIVSGAVRGIQSLRGSGGAGAAGPVRTDKDLPIWLVGAGAVVIVLACWLAPSLKLNILGGILILVFGFLFVTVSSRLTGEIGSSSNPISGMTVATLLLTSLIFVALGWTSAPYKVTALSVAAVVCISASNGGTTSQDLKTGYLIGATPWKQQVAILIGAFLSAIFIGYVILGLNDAGTVFAKRSYAAFKVNVAELTEPKEKMFGPEAAQDPGEYNVFRLREPLPAGKYLVDDTRHIKYLVEQGADGAVSFAKRSHPGLQVASELAEPKEKLQGPEATQDPAEYHVFRLAESEGVPAGKYLVDDGGQIRYLSDPGINGAVKVRDNGTPVTKYSAPKATLMSLIIEGIMSGKLPWSLVLLGVFISIVLELCGLSSLAFAVGVYLPLSTSTPIMLGGIVRWVAAKTARRKVSDAEAESGPGVLAASGLIAGGAIAGTLVAFLSFSDRIVNGMNLSGAMGALAESDLLAFVLFLGLAGFLYLVANEYLLKGSAEEKPAS